MKKIQAAKAETEGAKRENVERHPTFEALSSVWTKRSPPAIPEGFLFL